MALHARELRSPADLDAMLALARASYADNLHVVDLPYRLSSWALDDPENARLWFDERGALAAWAALQTPFWSIDYAVAPGAPGQLFSQILAWADRRALDLLGSPYGRPAWFANVFSDQKDRIAELKAAGFAWQSNVGGDAWSKVLLCRDLSAPPDPREPPAGFTIRPLDGEGEVEAYVELHREVFESRNMTTEWRLRTLSRPELAVDLVAAAPDGRLAAFCLAWLDRSLDPPIAQIEPMGVRAEFRGRGLGKAILSAALRQLQGRGAMAVVVETDNDRDAALALYQSVAFTHFRDVWVYRKNYGRAPSS